VTSNLLRSLRLVHPQRSFTDFNDIWYIHRVSKNVPPLTCYNCDVHGSIMIIFGISVTEKVGNQNVLYFPTSPNLFFCTTRGNRKPKKCIFSLKCCMLFTKNIRNTLNYHLVTAEPPFTVKRLTGCTRQDLESCCLLRTCSMVTKSVTVSVAV